MAKPVVSRTSPPRRNRVGSSSSETWAQRIGRPRPLAPATSPRRSSPMASRSATVVVTVPLLRRNVQQRTRDLDGRALARWLARLTACGSRRRGRGSCSRRREPPAALLSGGGDAGRGGGRRRRDGALDGARPDRVRGRGRGGGGRPRRGPGPGGGR